MLPWRGRTAITRRGLEEGELHYKESTYHQTLSLVPIGVRMTARALGWLTGQELEMRPRE